MHFHVGRVREGQGHKLGETFRPSQKSKGFLFIRKHCIKRFWGLVEWMLHIGEARHPGPRCLPSDRQSIECVNVGVWLSNGDLALESAASFLSVVEHRLIPATARSISKDLRVNYGHASVWAPACPDSIPGGHAGVGVVSLQGAPVTLPSFRTAEFGEYFRLGRTIRVVLPLASGSIAHLFVVYGYHGG